MNLTNLKTKIKDFEEQVASLKGKISILEDQFVESNEKIDTLKDLQITNKKSIELMNTVQAVTKDRIKETFETIVTNALQYIHQSNDYAFELEFGRRGNTPELNFSVKTPDMQEAHDIMNTRGGGTTDIVSLALRFVLLEVAQMPGYLFLDEALKHLDSPETVEKAVEFIKEIQKNSNRQIFFITHKDEVVDSVNNPIIIK
jgi:DNA repair exonuclease SbcCD ATPase subunit